MKTVLSRFCFGKNPVPFVIQAGRLIPSPGSRKVVSIWWNAQLKTLPTETGKAAIPIRSMTGYGGLPNVLLTVIFQISPNKGTPLSCERGAFFMLSDSQGMQGNAAWLPFPQVSVCIHRHLQAPVHIHLPLPYAEDFLPLRKCCTDHSG